VQDTVAFLKTNMKGTSIVIHARIVQPDMLENFAYITEANVN